MKILFNPSDKFERYNGGWTKVVTGIDKNYTNGFSIEGEFTTKDKKDWYYTEKLYLDCGIGGSRKNQSKYYNIFTINEDGSINIIESAKGKDWATDLWASIEKFFSTDIDSEMKLTLLRLRAKAIKLKALAISF